MTSRFHIRWRLATMGLLGLMMISLSARAQEVFVKQQISNINQKSICFAFRSHNHIPDSVASQFQQEIENTIDEFWHVGNKVQYIDYQQAKALRQSKNDNTLVMLVEHKTERHQPHNQRGMRHKQALKHSYFSFALYRPNQYWPLVEVSTKDENPDTLEIVSMINLMQYMLVQEQSGMTQQNWMSTINKSRNQIQGKNLLIDNQFADLSLLEQSGLSWNDVQQTNESEIIDSIRQHRQGATYAISSHVPGNAGQYYRTYIFDCQTANPIFVCSWKSN